MISISKFSNGPNSLIINVGGDMVSFPAHRLIMLVFVQIS